MLTREDDHGEHLLFFVVLQHPLSTPLHPFVQTSSWTKCLQHVVCRMESSRGKSAAIAFREIKVFKRDLATPCFCLYTIQQEVCNNCGGNEQFAREHSLTCDVFLGDIFLKRNICVVGRGSFCNKRLVQKQIPKRNFTQEAFRKTFILNEKGENDCGEHVLFVVLAPPPYILLSRHFAWTQYCSKWSVGWTAMGFPTPSPDLLLNRVFTTNVALKQQISKVHILETVYWGALAHCYVVCWGSCNMRCVPKKVREMYSQTNCALQRESGEHFWQHKILLGGGFLQHEVCTRTRELYRRCL